MEKISELNIFESEKRGYLLYIKSDEGFKGTVVNWELSSLMKGHLRREG